MWFIFKNQWESGADIRVHRRRQRPEENPRYLFCFILLKQILSLNLELRWHPASLSGPPVCALQLHYVTDTVIPRFLCGFWDLNSDPHVNAASIHLPNPFTPFNPLIFK